MTLNSYLKRSPLTMTAMAEQLGVSKGRLSQLRASKAWPPELALKVEKLTDGKVSASSLSPVIRQARAA